MTRSDGLNNIAILCIETARLRQKASKTLSKKRNGMTTMHSLTTANLVYQSKRSTTMKVLKMSSVSKLVIFETFLAKISFNRLFFLGDVFEKLEDEDEQGWCKGRKDGRVGLYPACYVEAVH